MEPGFQGMEGVWRVIDSCRTSDTLFLVGFQEDLDFVWCNINIAHTFQQQLSTSSGSDADILLCSKPNSKLVSIHSFHQSNAASSID